ncbi:MAG: hypothetical protein B6U72_07420 [Candidatus Altiarchaeales archaeon ex4484_2]|nr:MAG: hypothetical protein B6U72_07420 [Candidatus Altiarchaeales archaeon ex4484_2]
MESIKDPDPGKRKGQAAIEYLATYGWAILMVSIVAIVVWQMGILDPPAPPPDCRGFSQIRPMDWVFNIGGTRMEIVLVNEANTKLELGAGGVEASIDNIGPCNVPGPLGAINISAGSTATINVTVCPTGGMNPGDYYKARINITYTNIASGMAHTSVGSCWGSAE